MNIKANGLSAQEWKEKGNERYKSGFLDEALICYTNALQLIAEGDSDKAVFLKNRAAVYLKRKDYNKVIEDCSEALKIIPNDPKALFRRCQAYEAVERFEEAYQDALGVIKTDPNNKAIQPIAGHLFAICQEKLKQNSQLSTKTSQMFELAFKQNVDAEKKETAMNNLLVLAKEKAGADFILKQNITQKISNLFAKEKNDAIVTAAIRILAELVKDNAERTKTVLHDVGLPCIVDALNSKSAERISAGQYCIQAILNSCSGMDTKPNSKPKAELCDRHKREIDDVLSYLTYCTTNRSFSGEARDAVIELVMRNVHYDALNWANEFIELRGLQRLMEVASELEEYKYESAMDTTDSTRSITSVCLARIYENMYYDAAKEKFTAAIDEFINEKLLAPDIESKVRVVVAITTLLLGPLDVGNSIVARDGILQMIIAMASSEEALQQRVACECIIAASSKKDKAISIINQGVSILKRLYQSKEDGIRVRALVGLCKLSSSGGTDASIRPFADGASKKLAEACRRFLVNPRKDRDMRKWAVEGLSYLTFDAEVKEKLVEDKEAIRAMIEVGRTGDKSVVYGVVTTLVNLCNAYDKQEIIPEMIELAKFAKHHIPEESEFDDADFVGNRLISLAKDGVTTALVALAKTDSHNSRELVSRVFNAVCGQPEVRGVVVQQGATKALLPLALEGTAKGKRQASQALARLGITINPEVAFPGQRIYEVIRPLVNLLEPDCSALENFEGMMALCNLAGVSDNLRRKILKEGAFQKTEAYMFEDHEMLRRAATQVVNNLLMCDEAVGYFEGDNDRVKYLIILCQEEDLDTSLAAAGALAMLTSASKPACAKIFTSSNWLESIKYLLANPNQDLQHRGIVIVNNMIGSDKEVATRLIETDLMELLMAMTKSDLIENQTVRKIAGEALEAAAKWKLVQKIDPPPPRPPTTAAPPAPPTNAVAAEVD